MTANCTCRIADSFNVRAMDLVNPNCPIHGNQKVEVTTVFASREELEDLIAKGLTQVNFLSRTIYVLDYPFGPTDIARALLKNYEIRRKP